MKYSERFFKFPVRVYDRFSAEMSEKSEELQERPVEGDWREGIAAIELEELKTWNDYFDSEQGVEGVDESGYHYTLVFTRSQGVFISTWDRVKFEEAVDEYAIKYEEYQKKRREEMIKTGIMF